MVLVCALAVGWWAERREERRQILSLQDQLSESERFVDVLKRALEEEGYAVERTLKGISIFPAAER